MMASTYRSRYNSTSHAHCVSFSIAVQFREWEKSETDP